MSLYRHEGEPIDTWLVKDCPDYQCAHLVRFNKDGGYSAKRYASIADAEAELARWTAQGPCVECAGPLDDGYMEPYKTQILTRKLCFSCLFWTDYVERRSDPTHVVVAGFHYVITPDRQTSLGTLGHGGARFDIRFNDGREVVSHNLWAQGEVPAHFRDRLVDNAEFVKRGHVGVGNLRPGGGGYVGYGSADADCQF